MIFGFIAPSYIDLSFINNLYNEFFRIVCIYLCFKIYEHASSFVKKSLFFVSNRTSKGKTFKPKKKVPEGTKQYQLKQYAEATLGSGNLKLAVVLPEGEDLNEW